MIVICAGADYKKLVCNSTKLKENEYKNYCMLS